jgi:thiamine pyrophosphokinase
VTGSPAARHAIVLADGAAPARGTLDAAWPGWADGVDLVVAADGGVRHATPFGVRVDRWVGDGDSLGEAVIAELEAAGVPVERAREDKDESDTELAVFAARAMGATRLTILGAHGGPRVDHALANLGLLSMPELDALGVTLVAADARVRMLRGPRPDGAAVRLDLTGRVGDIVSLLPIGDDVDGVTTDGLRYPLRDEPLRAGRTRGLSNVRERSDATVELRRGQLLVIETPATL